MDMTGMVLISLRGYRTDSGFDLKYLGLRRLTAVGWGHRWKRMGGPGGLALSWLFPDCRQVPGSTQSAPKTKDDLPQHPRFYSA